MELPHRKTDYDPFHQASSLLWLLNLCSELKSFLANAMALSTSARLILHDLAVYLVMQKTDEPSGERKSLKCFASFGKASITLRSTVPGIQNSHRQRREQKILIYIAHCFLSLPRNIYF